MCSRWFGGVKLGTGGLSRAYSGSVKQALESLPTVEKVDRVRLRVTLGYADIDAFRRLVAEAGVVVDDERFADDVQMKVGVPVPSREAFEAAVAELTQGGARVEPL